MIVSKKPLHRILVYYRCLPIVVVAFCGYVIHRAVEWGLSVEHADLGMHHAGMMGAILTPVVMLGKFAFTLSQDDKIKTDNELP